MAFPHRGARSNPKLIGAAIFVCSLLFAYIVGQWVLGGGLSYLALRIAEVVGAAVALAVLVRWRVGILLFLVWLTFEDLARKFMGNNMLIYFVKDTLLLIVYGAFLVAVARGREKLFRPTFWVPLVALFSLGLVQVFNPRSTSPYYGVMGMKLYFYYMPLIFLGYSLVESQEDLDRFLSFTMKIAGIVAGVGIIQGLGWKNFLNPSSLAPQLQVLGHLTRAAPGMTRVLSAPPSVFVSQGRYANYLEMMFTLVVGVLAFHLFRRRPTKTAYLTLGVLGVAIFLSGSKGALVYALLTLVGLGVGLMWGARNQPWLSKRLGKIMRRSMVALAGGLCLIFFLFPNLTSAWGTYYYDLLWPDSASSQLGMRTGSYPLTEFEKVFEYAGWTTGYGTGTASLGVQYVTELLKAPPPPASPVENGFGDLIIEWGILGPILWVLTGAVLGISGWKMVKRLATTPLYPVGFAILWFVLWVLFPFTWGSPSTYQNYVVNAYLWTLVGILFRLPSLVATGGPRRPAPAVSLAPPAEAARVG